MVVAEVLGYISWQGTALALSVGLALRAGANVTAPARHRKRSESQRQQWGARWAGVVVLDVLRTPEQPVVAAAMADVRGYFGESFGLRPTKRLVKGLLYLLEDRIEWAPGTYWGRGWPHGWTIPLENITRVTIESCGRLDFNWQLVRVETPSGPIPLRMTDGERFCSFFKE